MDSEKIEIAATRAAKRLMHDASAVDQLGNSQSDYQCIFMAHALEVLKQKPDAHDKYVYASIWHKAVSYARSRTRVRKLRSHKDVSSLESGLHRDPDAQLDARRMVARLRARLCPTDWEALEAVAVHGTVTAAYQHVQPNVTLNSYQRRASRAKKHALKILLSRFSGVKRDSQ